MLASGWYGIVSVDTSRSSRSRRLVNLCADEGGSFFLGSSLRSCVGVTGSFVSSGLTWGGDFGLLSAGAFGLTSLGDFGFSSGVDQAWVGVGYVDLGGLGSGIDGLAPISFFTSSGGGGLTIISKDCSCGLLVGDDLCFGDGLCCSFGNFYVSLIGTLSISDGTGLGAAAETFGHEFVFVAVGIATGSLACLAIPGCFGLGFFGS